MVTNIWFGFFWHGLANIPLNQVFSNKARSGTKKCNQQLAKKKKSCTLKKKKHPHITPSFSNLFASILFLSLSSHFASLHTQISNGHDDHPISDILFTLLQVGDPRAPSRWEGFSPRLDISGDLREVDGVLSEGQKRAVLRGGIGRLIAMDFSWRKLDWQISRNNKTMGRLLCGKAVKIYQALVKHLWNWR